MSILPRDVAVLHVFLHFQFDRDWPGSLPSRQANGGHRAASYHGLRAFEPKIVGMLDINKGQTPVAGRLLPPCGWHFRIAAWSMRGEQE